MQERNLKEYTNASEVQPSKIPQAVLSDIANIIYAAMCKELTEKECQERTA